METISFDGTTVSYHLYGCGEPVVALHSTAGSGRQWEGLGLGLSQKFQVMAPDFYGHGQSAPWHGRQTFSLPDEAALVRAAMARFSKPVHLVGHSYGGAVALHLVLEQPERFRSLTLIEPVSVHLLKLGEARDRRFYAEIDQVAADIARGVLTGHHDAAMRGFVDYWNGNGAWDRLRESRRGELRGLAGTTLLNFSAISNNLTPLAAYRRINLPTLLIRGRNTRSLAARITDLLAANLRDVSSVVVENAGHMLPLTHPELVYAAISGHIMEYSAVGQSGFGDQRAFAA